MGPVEELRASFAGKLMRTAVATARGLEGSRYGEAGLRSTHEAAHSGWIRRWRGERRL